MSEGNYFFKSTPNDRFLKNLSWLFFFFYSFRFYQISAEWKSLKKCFIVNRFIGDVWAGALRPLDYIDFIIAYEKLLFINFTIIVYDCQATKEYKKSTYLSRQYITVNKLSFVFLSSSMFKYKISINFCYKISSFYIIFLMSCIKNLIIRS